MSRPRLPLLAHVVTPLALASFARGESLILTQLGNLDVSALNLNAVGDLAFEHGASKLWVCDAATGGKIFEVSPTNGLLLSQVDPAVIPGLTGGPDALAIGPGTFAPDLFAFSTFNQSAGGVVSQTNALVADFGTAHQATGADFDLAGNLWIASGTTANGGSTLQRLDLATGAVLQSVPILANASRVIDVAFDPHTGACYCLVENTNRLLEIDLASGAVLSQTELAPFLLVTNSIAGGVAFDQDGSRLFVATGGGAGADTIVRLQREFAYPQCDGADPAAPCPCGNAGAPGHGCDSSLANGGAMLFTTGVPSVAQDTLRLWVEGVPGTASCQFFQGDGAAQPVALGDGLLCTQGVIVRLGTRTASGGAAHMPFTGEFELSVRGQLPATGGTRFYQVWYRNAASFCTSSTYNLSNAVRVLWSP